MKPFTKILNQSYSVPEIGRGDTKEFGKPRFWITGGIHPESGTKYLGAVRSMWQTHLEYNKPFYLFASKMNTSKSHACVVAGEYIPYEGNRLIIVHRSSLKDQHNQHLQHWINLPNYLRNRWTTMTRQGVASLIKKYESGKELNEDETRRIEYIKDTCFVTLDELHTYSKGEQENLKQLIAILDFMLKHKLKIVLGTTATGTNLKAIWEWQDTFISQSNFTYHSTYEELKVEGWKEPTVEYLWADKNTELYDAVEVDPDQPDAEDFVWKVESNASEEVVKNLKGEGFDLKSYKMPKDVYIPNRIDLCIEHYIENYLGEPGILSVNGQAFALQAEEEYNKILKPLGYECVAWNTEGKNSHPVYKDREDKLLEDFIDPEHPLKFIFVNGMLREGINKPIKVAYQCNFSTQNADGSVQFTGRAKIAYIVVDALILKHLNVEEIATYESIAKVLKAAGVSGWTPEELQEEIDKFNAELAVEAKKMESQTQIGKKPEKEISKEAIDQRFINIFGGGSTRTNEEDKPDIWVYNVSHEGNTISYPVNKNQELSLPQKAQILDEFLRN